MTCRKNQRVIREESNEMSKQRIFVGIAFERNAVSEKCQQQQQLFNRNDNESEQTI